MLNIILINLIDNYIQLKTNIYNIIIIKCYLIRDKFVKINIIFIQLNYFKYEIKILFSLNYR